jgi:hypothetical protein
MWVIESCAGRLRMAEASYYTIKHHEGLSRFVTNINPVG